MLTISIDEWGQFEGVINEGQYAFVAGVIYDDNNDPADIENEKKRIEKYYRKVIKEALDDDNQQNYPKMLHVDANRTNSSKVGRVKQKVNETIKEFIEKGTYAGKRLKNKGNLLPVRKGKYYIYVYFLSNRGVSELKRDTTNFLTKDDFASNRYFHMSTGIVERLVFHNPIISPIDEVTFYMATRKSPNMRNNIAKRDEFVELKYKQNENDQREGRTQYQVASPDVYRTALAQSFLKSGRNINVKEFRVDSIVYTKDKENVMGYMADSLCSILADCINNTSDKRIGNVIKNINKKINEINAENRNLVFIYDDVDVEYQKAFTAYEKKDYINCLGIMFDSERREDEIYEWYKKKWYEELRKGIYANTYLNDLEMNVNLFADSLISNTYEQEKSIYIYNNLNNWADRQIDAIKINSRENILAKLYETGISVFCHIGDSVKATECYKKLLAYIDALGIEEQCSVLNKMAVVMSDVLDYDISRKYVEKSLEIQKKTAEVTNEYLKTIFNNTRSTFNSPIYAKTLSTAGQIYSMMHDKKAETEFICAMSIFEKNIFNYKITQSYLLQYYLEMNDKEKYEENAYFYFNENEKEGNEDSFLIKRINYIAEQNQKDNPEINYKYALFVLVKGIYKFEMDELSSDVFEKLKELEKDLKEKKNFGGHPLELVYKYLSLIALEKGADELAQKYYENTRAFVKDKGAMIDLIMTCNDIEYSLKNKNEAGTKESIAQAKGIIREQFIAVKDIAELDDDKFWEELKKKVNYMYS